MTRKITKEAEYALYSHREFKKDNTKVYFDRYNNGVTTLSLHGNNIARHYEDGTYAITTAGWDTNTTKERLRAIPGVNSLVTKKGVLFLNGEKWDGGWISI